MNTIQELKKLIIVYIFLQLYSVAIFRLFGFIIGFVDKENLLDKAFLHFNVIFIFYIMYLIHNENFKNSKIVYFSKKLIDNILKNSFLGYIFTFITLVSILFYFDYLYFYMLNLKGLL